MSSRERKRKYIERQERLTRLSEQLLSTWVIALVAFILGTIWLPLREKIPTLWTVAAAGAALAAFLSTYLVPEHKVRRRALFFSSLALLAGMLLGIGYIVGLPDEASLDWYAKDGNGRLTLLKGKPLTVAENRLGSDRLEIPIALAALNTGDRPLRDVKVEIRYPKGYKVIPQGKQRIDSQDSILVYEHSLDELKVRGAAVFLEETDKLVLRARVEVDDFILLTDQIPLDGQVQVVVYGPEQDAPATGKPPQNSTKTIPLKVTLFSEGRKVVDRVMEVTIPEAFGVAMYVTDSWSKPASPEERRLAEYAIQVPSETRLTGITFDDNRPKRPHRIDYRMGSYGATRYQIIRVDGIPRRLIVDTNNDGLRDYELWTNVKNNTRVFDTKFAYQKRVPFYPWTKHTVDEKLGLRRVR